MLKSVLTETIGEYFATTPLHMPPTDTTAETLISGDPEVSAYTSADLNCPLSSTLPTINTPSILEDTPLPASSELDVSSYLQLPFALVKPKDRTLLGENW